MLATLAEFYAGVGKTRGLTIEDVTAYVKAGGGCGNCHDRIQEIIDSIIGAASPVVLQYVPISASIAVAVNDLQLDRSRVKGFDYNGAANSLMFIGVKVNEGDQVVASYRRWVKQAVIN